MSQGSGNVSNVLGLGGAPSSTTASNLTIPENNSQGYFTLYMGKGGTVSDYYILYKNGTAYQVTSGKTCYVVGIGMNAPGSGNNIQLISATAPFADGASSITGGVYQGGASGNYPVLQGAAGTWVYYPTTFQFAASTYAGIQAGGTANPYGVYVICKEA